MVKARAEVVGRLLRRGAMPANPLEDAIVVECPFSIVADHTAAARFDDVAADDASAAQSAPFTSTSGWRP